MSDLCRTLRDNDIGARRSSRRAQDIDYTRDQYDREFSDVRARISAMSSVPFIRRHPIICDNQIVVCSPNLG